MRRMNATPMHPPNVCARSTPRSSSTAIWSAAMTSYGAGSAGAGLWPAFRWSIPMTMKSEANSVRGLIALTDQKSISLFTPPGAKQSRGNPSPNVS